MSIKKLVLHIDNKSIKQPKSSAIIFIFLLGNCLEILEFSLYGIYSKLFSQFFFSNLGESFGIICSSGIFAAGFVARPFGAIVFGHIGDKYGRRNALVLSALLMSLSTFGIGILPTALKIGIIAPVLLLILRIFQGISCGGEYNGVSIFLFEYFPSQPGKAGSFAAASGMLGTLIAICLGYISLTYVPFEWSWRIPFLFSLPLGFISLYIRFNVIENLYFKKEDTEIFYHYPLQVLLRSHLFEFVSTIFLGGFNGVLTFSLIVYTNIFLLLYCSISFNDSLLINLISVTFFIGSCLFFGFIKDKMKVRTELFLLLFSILTFMLSPFIYSKFLQSNFSSVLLGEVILATLAGGFSGLCNSIMCQLFPYNIRYSGVAIGYSIGVSTLGGTLPIISHILVEITSNPYSAFFYLAFGSIVGFAGCIIAYKVFSKRDQDMMIRNFN